MPHIPTFFEVNLYVCPWCQGCFTTVHVLIIFPGIQSTWQQFFAVGSLFPCLGPSNQLTASNSTFLKEEYSSFWLTQLIFTFVIRHFIFTLQLRKEFQCTVLCQSSSTGIQHDIFAHISHFRNELRLWQWPFSNNYFICLSNWQKFTRR